MSGINKVIILGRLGQDPEVKTFDDGGAVTSFSVATSEKWKKDGEDKEKTEWHRISCFGKLGEVAAKYLVKGRQVYIEGKIRTRSWDKDGETRYATDIIADKIEFIGDSKSSEDVQASSKQAEVRATPPPPPKAQKPLKNYAPGATNDDDFG